MDLETQWHHVESARRTLATLLRELTPEQWERQSLCSEWRVREVAGHLAMTAAGAPSTWEIVTGVAKARGNLWAFGRDIAIAWSARPPAEIVEALETLAASRTMPVVTNGQNMLLDVLVHGQDIAVPLGIDLPVPTDAGITAFHRIWDMGWPFHARKRLAGTTLVATDADLSVGDGPVVQGPLAALLLLTTGRTAAARQRLEGPGTALLPVAA